MRKAILPFLFFGIIIFFSIEALSQASPSHLTEKHSAIDHSEDEGHWLGILELPFMLLSVFFAFATAARMKNEKFGIGMRLLAWGFLVMATGHLHMQVEQFIGINLFGKLLGESGGRVVWALALIVTWGLSAFGLYNIYQASMGLSAG